MSILFRIKYGGLCLELLPKIHAKLNFILNFLLLFLNLQVVSGDYVFFNSLGHYPRVKKLARDTK